MVRNITQIEADRLLRLEKVKVNDDEWLWPIQDDKISVPLLSIDGKEKFLLDASSGRYILSKLSLQNRTRDTIILCRLDIGMKHRNPDGREIESPHLHLYREGFDDKWAYSLPNEVFSNINDKWQVLFDFMKYCNIIDMPNFRRGLFS